MPQTHRVLKDNSTSSKLGRTTWFTFLYFLFFFLRYQHMHKRKRSYIMLPPASMGLACKFSKLKARNIYTHK